MRWGVASEAAACPHTDRTAPHSHSPLSLQMRALTLDSSAGTSTGAGLVDSPAGRRAADAAGPALWDRPAKGRKRTTMAAAAAAAAAALLLPVEASRTGMPTIATHSNK